MKDKEKTCMIDNNSNIADDISSALNEAVHGIYAEHLHECNTIVYLGCALVFVIGAFYEYQFIKK
jgi:hypothetical protein